MIWNNSFDLMVFEETQNIKNNKKVIELWILFSIFFLRISFNFFKHIKTIFLFSINDLRSLITMSIISLQTIFFYLHRYKQRNVETTKPILNRYFWAIIPTIKSQTGNILGVSRIWKHREVNTLTWFNFVVKQESFLFLVLILNL